MAYTERTAFYRGLLLTSVCFGAWLLSARLNAATLDTAQADSAAKTTAAWTGKGPVRFFVEVPPQKIGTRKSDKMPARLKVDLADILARAGVEGRPDLARIQVVRLDPKTGLPLPCKTFRGIGPNDVPYRFDDFDRRSYSYWYNVRGNGHDGQIVWEHLQEGNRRRAMSFMSTS